MIIELTSFIVK